MLHHGSCADGKPNGCHKVSESGKLTEAIPPKLRLPSAPNLSFSLFYGVKLKLKLFGKFDCSLAD